MATKDWKKTSSSDIWIVWENKKDKGFLVTMAKQNSGNWSVGIAEKSGWNKGKIGLTKAKAIVFAKAYMRKH